MAISSRTRKMLWAKSGNRCALCRIELVHQMQSIGSHLIIGEECHIISPNTGPRHSISNDNDLDGFENLLLLCANDHTRIDSLEEIYPVETLKLLKRSHEEWVRTTLERDSIAFMNDVENIKSMPRVKTGKQVLDIVIAAHIFHFNHDELDNIFHAELVGEFLENLREYGNIVEDLGYLEIAKYSIDLNEKIKQIEHNGFYLYGLKRKINYVDNNGRDIGILDMASLAIVNNNNPAIVGDFLIAKFPKHQKTNFNI